MQDSGQSGAHAAPSEHPSQPMHPCSPEGMPSAIRALRRIVCLRAGVVLLGGSFLGGSSLVLANDAARVIVQSPSRWESAARKLAESLAREDATDDQLARLGAELVESGLLEAQIVAAWSGDTLRVTVDTGPVAHWDTLAVEQRGTLESPRIDASQPEDVGERRHAPFPALAEMRGAFDRQRFESTLDAWIGAWAESGHPFAVATLESLIVRDGMVRAGLRCDPGPAVTIGEVVYPGLRHTRESFLVKWTGLAPGMSFRDSRLQQARRRLEQSDLFSFIGQPELEPLGEGRVRVHLPVHESAHNEIEGAIGYQGESGTLSGLASVRLGNLFGTGRALALRWERYERAQSAFDLSYREPLVLGLPLSAGLRIQQEVRDSTYTLDRFEGELELRIASDFFVSLGGERRRSVLGAEPSTVVRRTSTIFGARWDGLRPGYRGGLTEADFRTGTSRIDPPIGPSGRERVGRVEARAERYLARGSLSVRAGARAGGLQGARQALDPSEALWIGGAAMLRGHAERAFAAERYGIGQLEVGALLGQGRAYGFVDAGWLRELARDQERTPSGFGVGFESGTARQRISLDLALAGGSSFSEARLHLSARRQF